MVFFIHEIYIRRKQWCLRLTVCYFHTELLLFNYAKVKTVFHSMAPLRVKCDVLNVKRKTRSCIQSYCCWRFELAYLSKLCCAILAMNEASPTTCAIRPRASPAAQRRIGLGLSSAPITSARADLRTSSGPRLLLFSARPCTHTETNQHY